MKKTALIIIGLLLAINAFSNKKRVVVAQDGSGDYKTVQAAFDAVPLNNKSAIEIYIKKGVYKECLTLEKSKSHVIMMGEDKNNTILTYNNHKGIVTARGDTINTYTSASFFIYADDFKANNLTFQNDAGFTAGQAVAVYAYGDKLIFDNCSFNGFQDVLFCSGPGSRQFYRNCNITGTTDFIFGPATAVFEKCYIHSKKNSHVTAASTSKDEPFGFVFFDCTLTADTNLHNVSLGRPWQPYASVVYIRCNIGPHIIAGGWNNWKNQANEQTARYAEYKSTGPGANPDARVKWSRQLTDDEVKVYTLKNILGGKDNWDPLKEL
ncbi:MAG TPA: pectinesterase family protein [Mucilaginibacter sp.]|jgi:pectinesterase